MTREYTPLDLNAWAAEFNIHPTAMAAFRHRLNMLDAELPESSVTTEAGLLRLARLEASKRGDLMMRNNVGAYETESEGWVRYGLMNDTKALNRVLKSSDGIGIHRLLITPAMVGTYVGQFDAKEFKKPGWRYTGTPREIAQQAFGLKVIAMGGRFSFVSHPDQC